MLENENERTCPSATENMIPRTLNIVLKKSFENEIPSDPAKIEITHTAKILRNHFVIIYVLQYLSHFSFYFLLIEYTAFQLFYFSNSCY